MSVQPKFLILDISNVLTGLPSHYSANAIVELVNQAIDSLIDSRYGWNASANNIPRVDPRFLNRPTIAELEEAQSAFASVYLGIILSILSSGMSNLVDDSGEFLYVPHEVSPGGRLVLRKLSDA